MLRYLNNISILPLYEQFVAKCPKFRPISAIWKNIQLLEWEQIIYHFKARDLEIPNMYIYILCHHVPGVLSSAEARVTNSKIYPILRREPLPDATPNMALSIYFDLYFV